MGRVILLLLVTFFLYSQHACAEQKFLADIDYDLYGPGETIAVKLRPTLKRRKEDVRAVAERLKALPELAGASVAAVSRDIVSLTPSRKHNMEEIIQLLLQQPDVYELEVGDDLHRRAGDKPYDQLRKDMVKEAYESTKSKLEERFNLKLDALAKKRRKAEGALKDAVGEDGQPINRAMHIREVADRVTRQLAERLEKRKRRREREQQASGFGEVDAEGPGEVREPLPVVLEERHSEAEDAYAVEVEEPVSEVDAYAAEVLKTEL